MNRLTRNLHTTGLALIFSLLAAAVAWLGLITICLYDSGLSICRHPSVGWVVPLGTLALAWLWIAAQIGDRLRRRLRRGMWAGSRPMRNFEFRVSSWMGHVAKFALDGELPESVISGTDRFERRGWWCWVECYGGMDIWVDRAELWHWLHQVEVLHRQLPPGESAISQRRWESKLGRALWMAYIDILEATGGADCPTGDPRSRRYVPGLPWGRIEQYEKMRASEVK